ncbi:hypothetical protein Hanom_Chr03g00184111 [Helianthus anomalus]
MVYKRIILANKIIYSGALFERFCLKNAPPCPHTTLRGVFFLPKMLLARFFPCPTSFLCSNHLHLPFVKPIRFFDFFI